MRNLNARFYWDTAKFCFSVVGGGTAGFFLMKGANMAIGKAASVAQLQVASKLLDSDGADDGPISLGLDDDDDQG